MRCWAISTNGLWITAQEIKKLKTLVLGGCGFLGSHIVDALVADGLSVRVLDRVPNRFRSPQTKVEYLFGDWSDHSLLDRAIEQVDTVVHLISATLPAPSNQDPQFDIAENLMRTLHLLDRCVATGVRRIVFASSGGTVYGRPQSLPISENHPTDPLNSHGIVKLTIEKYLALYHQLYGLEYVALRTGNPYGELQDPAGEQGFIAVAMGRLLYQQPITIYGSLEVQRDYLYVGDVAQAFLKSACLRNARHIFNVGSGHGLSLQDLLAKISAITGRAPEIQIAPSRAADVPANVLNIELIKHHLNWQPMIDFDIGLERTWQWIKNQFG